MYEKTFSKVWEVLVFKALYGGFHGSEVRDLMLEHYPNCGALLDTADTLLKEMVEDEILEHFSKPTPTTSQIAFAGLFYSKDGYRQTGWAAGTREHFFYVAFGDKREGE